MRITVSGEAENVRSRVVAEALSRRKPQRGLIYGGILLSTASDEVIAYVPDAKGRKLTHISPYERDA